jgi:hypothetical protein
MHRVFTGVACAVLPCLFAAMAWPEPHLKCRKIAVTNPTDQNRPPEDVVISIPELRKIGPVGGRDHRGCVRAAFPRRTGRPGRSAHGRGPANRGIAGKRTPGANICG